MWRHYSALTISFPFVFFLSFSYFFLSSRVRIFPCIVRYSMQKSLSNLQKLSIWIKEGRERRENLREGVEREGEREGMGERGSEGGRN